MQMDFLDPRRKKAHKQRLFIGYFLMSIAIGLGTVLIVSLANGFWIDPKDGSLIQNGTVYVDSQPQNARVIVNGVEQRNRTDTRLSLPAGDYTIEIEAEGYRHWERTFSLDARDIKRIRYPYLIPNTFVTTDVSTYESFPGLATQSPDRRWLLAQKPGSTYQFDLFDLNDPQKAKQSIELPKAVLEEPDAKATLKFVEWSTDNRHVLFERTYGDKTEFVLFDIEKPVESTSINKSFGINPKVVSLKNKRPDQFYYLEVVPGVLRVADLSNKTISAPLLDAVIDYKTYGDDIVLYATGKDAEAGKADFRILENDKNYKLKTVALADKYVMDVSKYENQWYYVVGSSNEELAFVYEDPLPALKQNDSSRLVVHLLRIKNPRFASFSAGTQFIGVQSGNEILTIDLEDNHQYRLKLSVDIAPDYQVKWMDGHRFIYTAADQSYIIDFDGSNEETLVTSKVFPGPFFDRDYDNVFTFEDSKSQAGKKALTMTVIED